ncbi:MULTISPECIES: guanylate kinase [Paenibacillus]|uniref:Guanylate kinase n=2 Tax=Paenibacillus TaxID=44249 RepID=A0A1C1A8R7_9BACL|nr:MULTISPECIES: guanylate kinase [Paenibacillus]KRE72364.1 guanylate kinase [Paenibacillus sp. Soil750]NQX57480.1 guanylate kinase [Paenibacillus qinlingensis]OCT16980.1 guanylate kinase [Paenibacillus pectinilyticus]CAH1205078.1 Guanylate kinase [Paenibacillus allorhizoplanae]
MTSNTNTLERERGILIVLSGPSGVGKGTVCAALRKVAPDIVYSVSATTRSPRQGEVDGVNYFFKTREQFQQLIETDEVLEWAEYVGNFYGTPRRFVEETLRSGHDVILEIEVQGALQVKQKFDEGVFIFLLPPSLDELENRIVTRGTETDEVIRSRMSVAIDEIRLMEHYDYAIVNDHVDTACAKIQAILAAEHCKKDRMFPKIVQWMDEVN